MAIDASNLRHGRVRGRYFRENFAQAGIDLTQIIPELVTNADAAIAAAGGERGRIELRIGPADPAFLQVVEGCVRSLRVPALGAGDTSSSAPTTAKASTPTSSTNASARSASSPSTRASAASSAADCATSG